MDMHAAPEPTEAFRREKRDWLRANLPPGFRTDGPDYRSPTLEAACAWESAMHRGGLAGIMWPPEYGGHGLSIREHLVANQEIGRVPMPESVNSIGKELAGPIILAVGNKEQKHRFLPAILEMRDLWCQGFSEPEAGSDLAGLRTRAVPDGDGWRVTGQKIWTSGGMKAHRCLLLARTGKLEDRHKGLALFAVRMDSEGLTRRPIKQIDGQDEFAEVFFDNVWIDGADALGLPDEGWSAAIRVLAIERATNRMYRAWRFENELHHLVTACRSEPTLAALLGDGQYRRRLAETAADIEAVKGHVEPTVEKLARGEAIGARGSLMKLHWSEAHQRFAALAQEMLSQAPPGASPCVKAAQRRFGGIYLRSRAETIYAGTTEIQLGIIADRILDLPKGK